MPEFSKSDQVVDAWFEGTVTGSGNTFNHHGEIIDRGRDNRYCQPHRVRNSSGEPAVRVSNASIPGLPPGMKATFHKF